MRCEHTSEQKDRVRFRCVKGGGTRLQAPYWSEGANVVGDYDDTAGGEDNGPA